jgi:hypothetical protein
MLRLLISTALSAALFAAVAGSTTAATPVDDSPPSGDFVEPLGKLDLDVIVEEDPIETYYELDANGKPVPYKCRSAKVAYVKKTLLGAVAYKWWMKRSWCWRFPRLVSVGTKTYVTDMNGFNEYKGIVASWGAWFEWCCNEPRSGHKAFRQAEFQNCIVKYGCLSTTYPWIRMSVRGDGSYAYAIGD